MIYAIRGQGQYATLIELTSKKALDGNERYVSPAFAKQWVQHKGLNEIGLWIDRDGRVKYAQPQR